MLPKLLYQDSLQRWHLIVKNTRINKMDSKPNHQPEELQLLEKIILKSGKVNQQLSVRETLGVKQQITPKLPSTNNRLESQFAHSILELRQAYQEIQLQIVENERIQKLIQEQAELLNLVHDAILIRDLNNIISFWNHGAEKMYGFLEHEALAKQYHILLKTQFPRPFSEIQAEVLQKGRWEGELIQTKSDGTQIVVCSRWVLKKDAQNQPQKIIEINKDITDRKQAEAALLDNESILRSFYHTAPMMMGIIQVLNDNILHISDNTAAAEFFGTTPEAMQNQFASDFSISSQHINKWIDRCYESEKTGNPGYFEYEQNTALGLKSIAVTVCPIQKLDRKITATESNKLILSVASLTSKIFQYIDSKSLFCYSINDITDRKESEETLQKTNEKLTRWIKELEVRNQEIILLGEMSNILQACLTTEEAYNTVAQLIEPLFPNMSGAIFVISNSKQLVSSVASWGNVNASTEMLFTPNECWGLRRGRSHLMESSLSAINCKHTHHDSPNVESLCLPMMAQGEALGILYLSTTEKGILTQAKQQLAITVAEQIALAFANLKLHEALQQQSIRDPLTGLFNRHYLEESLEREISRAERKQQSVGIIMLDVDHFKCFNDTFGHDGGDTLLRELGIFIKKNIRGSDIACRFGGEELILILPEASLEVTVQRAEQIREGIKHLNLHNRHQQLGTITLSLGIAIFPLHGTTGEMVIQAADSALYKAKGEGRDRVIIAS